MEEVQATLERWMIAIYGQSGEVDYVAKIAHDAGIRRITDNPMNLVGKMQHHILEALLLATQARMLDDEGVQLKKEDFYYMFDCIENILNDQKFVSRVSRSHVLKRQLHVPPPPF